MVPVEHLHLDLVRQIVCVLESVILRCFGPDGGQVLFIRDTGQAMLSRSGSRILSALRLEHPLARMVVDCVLKHSNATGDGSKTFVLLLASLLRALHAAACKEPNVSHAYTSRYSAEAATARHLAYKILEFASGQLENLIATAVTPYGRSLSWDYIAPTAQLQANADSQCVQKLLASFFCSRLSRSQCDFATSLACDLLTNCKITGAQPLSSLQFLTDNFPILHTRVSGFPFTCSHLVEGQVIHRDFATPCPPTDSDRPVKAVVLTGDLEPEILTSGEVLALCGQTNIVRFKAWAERSLRCIFASLQKFGISLLLSAVKQSPAVLSLAAQANICVVECVSKDDLAFFAQLSQAQAVSDSQVIGPNHIATLIFCRAIHLGAHRYVHLAFPHSKEKGMVKPCNLIICGPGEGQTDQYASAVHDAIRMLLSACQPLQQKQQKKPCFPKSSSCLLTDHQTGDAAVLEPGCVIPAGGTFEFLLVCALQQHGRKQSGDSDMDVSVVSKLLLDALLTVPRQIYGHSQRQFLQTQDRILNFIQTHLHPFSLVSVGDLHCCGATGTSSNIFREELGLESVSCKYQLLLAVAQCASHLLQVDTVLHTHIILRTKSHQLANNSLEGKEDEADT